MTAARATIAVTPSDAVGAEWDVFVERAEGSTFCHLAAWREIMGDVLGHECLYSVARDETGAWLGVLPLVRVKSRLFGHYLVSMPFLNYGGPLGGAAAQSVLAEYAVGEARRSGADLLELRSRHEVPSDMRISHRKITVLLDLPASPDLLWSRTFTSKLRTKIRRVQKDGMETRFGADQWQPFYEIFAHNMRDLGTPVLPRALFERIARVFGDRAVFGAVYLQGRAVAAGCGFIWRDEFEMTWSSGLRAFNARRPNFQLYASYMEKLICRGVRVFNFGRCTPGSGTHEFKRQWGGRDVPLPWGHWAPGAAEATPSPDRPLYRLAARTWSWLPLPLTKAWGPLLARLIP